MNFKKALLLFLLLINVSCFGQSTKINGLSFVTSSKEIHQKHINPVVKTNANYVVLMPFGFIKDLASPKITFNSNRQWFGETTKGGECPTLRLLNNQQAFNSFPLKWIFKIEINSLLLGLTLMFFISKMFEITTLMY